MNTVNRVTTLSNLLSVAHPEQTSTYKPILYGDLDTLVKQDIEKAGFQLESTRFLSAHEGLQADGIYYLKSGQDKEMGMQIAWQNSYDKKVPLRFAVGGYVFLCTNGAMVGDLGLFYAKHQGEIQQITPGTLTEIILNAGNKFDQMIVEREKMKEISLTKRTCAELVGRLFIEEQIINTTQMGIISREIENPSFNYGENKNSLWQLYNDCTLAFKQDHPAHYMTRHIQTHQFFKKEFELA